MDSGHNTHGQTRSFFFLCSEFLFYKGNFALLHKEHAQSRSRMINFPSGTFFSSSMFLMICTVHNDSNSGIWNVKKELCVRNTKRKKLEIELWKSIYNRMT